MNLHSLRQIEQRIRAMEERAAARGRTGVLELPVQPGETPQQWSARARAMADASPGAGWLILPDPIEDHDAWAALGRSGGPAPSDQPRPNTGDRVDRPPPGARRVGPDGTPPVGGIHIV